MNINKMNINMIGKFTLLVFSQITLTFSQIANCAAGGADVGNGGNSYAQEFTLMGYLATSLVKQMPELKLKSDVEQKLIEAIQNAKVRPVDKLDEMLEAKNYPKARPQVIEFIVDSWKQKNRVEKLSLALHEYLGLIDLEVNTYTYSALFRDLLDKQSIPGNPTPTLLASFYPENDGVGMSSQDAFQMCEHYKAQYEKQFYAVYCEYLEEGKYETTYEREYQDRFELVGYQSVEHGRNYVRGSYIHYSRYENPIWVHIQVPYYQLQHNYKHIYGLKVFGLGKLDELNWTLQVDSRSLGEEQTIRITYEEKLDATLRCKQYLFDLKARRPELYHKSRCVIAQDKDQYYFTIETKNPFKNI